MSKADGQFIGIQFTQPITSDLDAVAGHEYRTPTDAAVTTLNQYSSTYTGANTIDDSTSTYWRGTTAVNWLQYQLPEAACITGFRWYTSTYYPLTFTISGSNDGSTFTQLSDTLTRTASGWEEFTFTNTEQYLYYRINILTAYSSSRLYIYEVDLLYETGIETAFTVSGQEYDMEPDGTLQATTYSVISVTAHPTEERSILLEIAELERFESVVGDLTISYDATSGNLAGQGGPVASFSVTFTPEDLIRKPDVNDPEHIEVAIAATGTLLAVTYTDTQENENIEVAIAATGTLIHIDDL